MGAVPSADRITFIEPVTASDARGLLRKYARNLLDTEGPDVA